MFSEVLVNFRLKRLTHHVFRAHIVDRAWLAQLTENFVSETLRRSIDSEW
jgi:hypothetical protein